MKYEQAEAVYIRLSSYSFHIFFSRKGSSENGTHTVGSVDYPKSLRLVCKRIWWHCNFTRTHVRTPEAMKHTTLLVRQHVKTTCSFYFFVCLFFAALLACARCASAERDTEHMSLFLLTLSVSVTFYCCCKKTDAFFSFTSFDGGTVVSTVEKVLSSIPPTVRSLPVFPVFACI